MSILLDHTNLKLGRKAPILTAKVVPLSRYKTSAFPPLPVSWSWSTGITGWPMMLNDQEGDCTIAAVGHTVQLMTTVAGKNPQIIPDPLIEAAYEAIGGYKPGEPDTDGGCVETEVLKYWQKTGIGGHKIDGWIGLERGNFEEFKQAIYTFGCAYIGVSLPESAQGQTSWFVPTTGTQGPGEPGSWGGHAVIATDWDANGRVKVITWGTELWMTEQFYQNYVEEAYAVVSHEWVTSTGKTPTGLDYATLLADLRQL